MNESLLRRIQREAGAKDLVEVLADKLPPTDLQSLLLEVYARIAARVTPARLLEQHETNRFVMPSAADPRRLAEVERLAWELLPSGYIPVELAPLCPLGTNSAIASVHQNKVVSTARNVEVVADSTNVMALECAVRRRRAVRQRRPHEKVLLTSTHRVTRAQAFGGPKSWAHFRTLALCAAGRDEGSFRFESRQLIDHLRFYVSLLRSGLRIGRPFANIRFALTDLSSGNLSPILDEKVVRPMQAQRIENPVVATTTACASKCSPRIRGALSSSSETADLQRGRERCSAMARSDSSSAG